MKPLINGQTCWPTQIVGDPLQVKHVESNFPQTQFKDDCQLVEISVNDEPSLQPNIVGWQCVGTKLPVHTWLNMLASCLILTCSTVWGGGLQTV